MTEAAFRELWAVYYPLAPPLPHLLRQAYPERWLRIHSLPDAQRYPANNADWSILLTRQLTVLTDVFSPDEELLLLSGYYSPDGEIACPDPQQLFADVAALADKRPIILASHCLADSSQEPDSAPHTYWSLLLEPAPAPAASEQLLRAIAWDECRAFLMAPAQGTTVAPYDGGIDLFLPDRATRDAHQRRYRAWLSTRPDGR